MSKKPAWKPDKFKQSKSGADTPRSTDVVRHGGKVDPDALLRRIELAAGGSPAAGEHSQEAAPGATGTETGDQSAAIVRGDDDAPNRVVFVLQRDLDKRLDKYLCDRIPFMSRTQLQRLIDEGGVTVNARAPKPSTKLRAGDTVEIYVPPPPSSEIAPEDIPIDVLFEDEHLIVLNKSPDIIVHPARSHNSGTMVNALAFHFKHRSMGSLSAVGSEFARPGVVHRLDRHTSGLIIFAKSDEAHWRLGSQFEKRTVDKRYLALVHGIFQPPVDTIDLPIGPHPSRERGKREQYVVRHDHLGKPSLTVARLRQAFTLDPDAQTAAERGFSLVELELKTGRTHQIRVHLSHRGFPIAGDDMYGGKALFARAGNRVTTLVKHAERDAAGNPRMLIDRQALHAATLRFRHPADQRVMEFAAPLPADFGRTLAALRAADPSSAIQTPPGAAVPLTAPTLPIPSNP